MAEHGSASRALAALPEVARAAGVADYHLCPEGVVRAELKAGRAAGARLLACGEPGYPAALAALDDAPPLLWALGESALLHRPLVALVGARNASSLGLRMARSLSAALAEAGCVVVSGLARGIDAAAHGAALEGGTVAVMAGGVDVLYPAENTRLAEEIVAQGGLRLSEQPMRMQPLARHFPVRNRIISGMASAVVVVEAAVKSGSLITARAALDQGREVMAVPGHPLDGRAGGCNLLIRDGARLVRNAEDVLEQLPREAVAPPPPAPPAEPDPRQRQALQQAAALHQQILDRLGPSPVSEDQLIRDLGAGAKAVSPALTDLELDGRVQRQPGGLLSLVPR
jgi:DNA processing protein